MVIQQWHDQKQQVKTIVTFITVTSPRPSATGHSVHVGAPLAMTHTSSGYGDYSAPSRQHRPQQTTSSPNASQTWTSDTEFTSSTVSSPLFEASNSADASNTSNTFAPLATDSADLNQTTKSQGLSSGGKAGLAIGILIVIALMAGLAFFFVRRRKQEAQNHQRLSDEKTEMRQKSQSVSSHVSVRRTKTNAPRLSLRPVTQMFMGMSEKQEIFASNSSRGLNPEPIAHAPPRETINPFGDPDEKLSIASPAIAAVAPPLSSTSSNRTLSNLSDSSPAPGTPAFPTVVSGSRRNSPPGPGPNNVHRVQLDFKPSMEDELELRAGSLVRLLHEYDDGWALCIRLDRSQQGVVPRTCISKLPVKPRPGPPPPGAMRGPNPNGQGRTRGGSNAPAGRIPFNGPPRAPAPNQRFRSQSNAPRQPRAQSPALSYGPSTGRPRANSDAVNPPNGPSQAAQAPLPARKPVPGQAI